MSVEINTDEVIRVGRDLYPDLAAKYRVIATTLGTAQITAPMRCPAALSSASGRHTTRISGSHWR